MTLRFGLKEHLLPLLPNGQLMLPEHFQAFSDFSAVRRGIRAPVRVLVVGDARPDEPPSAVLEGRELARRDLAAYRASFVATLVAAAGPQASEFEISIRTGPDAGTTTDVRVYLEPDPG